MPFCRRFSRDIPTASGVWEPCKRFRRSRSDDIRNFAAQHLARDTVTVAVAGDMTAEELSSALDKIFADLPARAKLKPVADVKKIDKTPTILVRRDGTQTEMLFAMPGPKRADPDYYAAASCQLCAGRRRFCFAPDAGCSRQKRPDVRHFDGLFRHRSTRRFIVGRAAVDNPKAGEALETIHGDDAPFLRRGADDARNRSGQGLFDGCRCRWP